jgi:asparagine synthase (glutamine-hydrolysing)
MSGQAGIYYYDHRPIDRSLADRLDAGLSRQGPDGGGHRFGDGLLMVYRAFHVEPESYLERQPYVSPKGNWMTWDGRLDNRDDLLLLVKDHLHDDTTDVALAMAAYEKWGEPGFNRLIGDWSLALCDRGHQSIILASDYLGVRPLYYYARRDCIAWSSDLDLLVSWMGVENDLDNHYIAAFLTGSPKNDRTIYRPISFVPCAHAVQANEGNLTKTPFWYPPVDSRIRYRRDEDYEEHLLHLFREAVLTRLRTDHTVCCDLSGGLDSSSVTCMAHHLIQSGATSPKQLITFSWIDSSMEEERYVEMVENQCRIAGIHLPLRPVWSLDAPSAAMPIRSDFIRDERGKALADRSVHANLTGYGGDLVMGNTLGDTDQLADDVRQGAWRRVFQDAYAWSRAMRIPIWSVLKQGIIPLLPAMKQQQQWRERNKARSQAYSQLQQDGILDRQFLDKHFENDLRPYGLCYRDALPSQRRFLHGISTYQTHRTLNSLQQLESIRSTNPYCHRPLVEFSASVPRQQLCRPGFPRSLMRRAFRGFLPPGVQKRSTKGLFGIANNRSILELASILSRGQLHIEKHGVDCLRFRQILQNTQRLDYNQNELIQALTLEVWFRTRGSVQPHDTHEAGQSYSSQAQTV